MSLTIHGTLWLALAALQPAQRPTPAPVLHYERFQLGNGLTVLVHEDHTAPIVAVHVWYHVGSKDEQPGRTGFAHLFEHLMFNGSENYNDEYFGPLERVGASPNGGTNSDRTSYHQIVPTAALDLALFMESDRMGHLLGALTQAKLDEQRGVVINEVRQGADTPYGHMFDVLTAHAYPNGHGYSWPVAGSLEDLGRATLEDARAWFHQYYGPTNALVVLAGDIDVATARARVQHFFGDIPAGAPLTRRTSAFARMTENRRSVQEDLAAREPRFVRVWNVPGYAHADAAYLALLARILGGDESSRLWQRLVTREGVVTSLLANIQEHEIGSQFYVRINVPDAQSLARVERTVDEEISRLISTGPTPEEIAHAARSMRAEFLRNAESVGGPDGRAEMLATGEIFASDPTMEEKRVNVVAAASRLELVRVASRWLGDGSLTLHIHPRAPGAVTAAIDRSALPAVAPPASAIVPVDTAALASGLRVAVVNRPTTTIAELRLILHTGGADDPVKQRGRAALATQLLREAIVREAETVGMIAQVEAIVNPASSTLRMSIASEDVERAIGLLAHVVTRPVVDPAALRRQRASQLSQIRAQQGNTFELGRRVVPALMCGTSSPSGAGWSALGDSATVAGLTVRDVQTFYREVAPNSGAVLVIVSALSRDSAVTLSGRALASWHVSPVMQERDAACETQSGPIVYLLHREGGTQSMIMGALPVPPKRAEDDASINVFQRVFGGLVGRLSNNLREEKHWSYGAYAVLEPTVGGRVMLLYAPVQADKTTEALQEMVRELRDVGTTRPISEQELADAKSYMRLSLPVRLELASATAAEVSDIMSSHLPANYLQEYSEAIGRLTTATVRTTVQNIVGDKQGVWLVIGDRRTLLPKLRDAGLGPVVEVREDGTRVDTKP